MDDRGDVEGDETAPPAGRLGRVRGFASRHWLAGVAVVLVASFMVAATWYIVLQRLTPEHRTAPASGCASAEEVQNYLLAMLGPDGDPIAREAAGAWRASLSRERWGLEFIELDQDGAPADSAPTLTLRADGSILRYEREAGTGLVSGNQGWVEDAGSPFWAPACPGELVLFGTSDLTCSEREAKGDIEVLRLTYAAQGAGCDEAGAAAIRLEVFARNGVAERMRQTVASSGGFVGSIDHVVLEPKAINLPFPLLRIPTWFRDLVT